jgi:hypothetical protein
MYVSIILALQSSAGILSPENEMSLTLFVTNVPVCTAVEVKVLSIEFLCSLTGEKIRGQILV